MNYQHQKDGRFGELGLFGRMKARIIYGLNWLWFGFVWRILPLAIVAVGTFGYFSFGGFRNETVAYAQTLPAISHEMKGKTVDQLEDEFIDQLAKAENQGGVPCYPDDNSRGSLPKKDKVSCGPMSYKVSTVQRHAKGCYGDILSNEEAILLAIDAPKAKALAKCAIFGKQNAIDEWMAATESMKIKVSLIREMAN